MARMLTACILCLSALSHAAAEKTKKGIYLHRSYWSGSETISGNKISKLKLVRRPQSDKNEVNLSMTPTAFDTHVGEREVSRKELQLIRAWYQKHQGALQAAKSRYLAKDARYTQGLIVRVDGQHRKIRYGGMRLPKELQEALEQLNKILDGMDVKTEDMLAKVGAKAYDGAILRLPDKGEAPKRRAQPADF